MMQASRSNPIASCATARASFSEYLDGRLSGLEMAALARHLDGCAGCDEDFAGLRATQRAIASLGAPKAPADLHARLSETLRVERARGTHLPLTVRIAQKMQLQFSAFALQAAGGLSLALALAGGLFWIAAPLAEVQANDERVAHLNAPHYLYSQVPPQPVLTQNDAPLLVDAKVDEKGRVYDYSIVAGSADAKVKLQVEQNLLASIFRPATVFGIPVPGHVMLTYSGVSVRG